MGQKPFQEAAGSFLLPQSPPLKTSLRWNIHFTASELNLYYAWCVGDPAREILEPWICCEVSFVFFLTVGVLHSQKSTVREHGRYQNFQMFQRNSNVH